MRYAVLFLLALAACESQAEIDARRETRQRNQDVADHTTCADFGITAGTPVYADCRLRLREMHARDAAARRAAALQWYGMQQRQQQPVYRPRTPTRTNCTNIGRTINCTTY